MFTQGFFVLFTNITALSIAPLTPIYVAQFQTSLSRVALLVSPLSPLEAVCQTLTGMFLGRQERALSHLVTRTLSSFPAPMSLAGGR
jgi:hypothetical protein